MFPKRAQSTLPNGLWDEIMGELRDTYRPGRLATVPGTVTFARGVTSKVTDYADVNQVSPGRYLVRICNAPDFDGDVRVQALHPHSRLAGKNVFYVDASMLDLDTSMLDLID